MSYFRLILIQYLAMKLKSSGCQCLQIAMTYSFFKKHYDGLLDIWSAVLR